MRRLAALVLTLVSAFLLVGPLPAQARAPRIYDDPAGDVKIDAELGQPPAEQLAAVDIVELKVKRVGRGLRAKIRFAGPPPGGMYYPFVNFYVDEPSHPVSRFGLGVAGQPLRGTGDALYQRSPDTNDVIRCVVGLSLRGATVRIDVPPRCTPPPGRAVVGAEGTLLQRGAPYDTAAWDRLRAPGAPGVP